MVGSSSAASPRDDGPLSSPWLAPRGGFFSYKPPSGCEAEQAEIGSLLSNRTRYVQYISTRDPRPAPQTHSFMEVLLGGVAEDGGLYVPEDMPEIGVVGLHDCAGLAYAELAARLVSRFAGDAFSLQELRRLTVQAYAKFRHAAVTPLVQIDERLWLL